jgi:hypothetical protein
MKNAARLALLLSLAFLAAAPAPAQGVAGEVPLVVGIWDAVVTTPEGDMPAVISIRQAETGLKAEVDVAGFKRAVTNEKLEGSVLRMRVEYEGNFYDVEGKVEGDVLDGTWQGASYSGTLKAKRRP